MTDWDDNVHSDLERFLKRKSPNKLILMPRGHFKSSVVTIGFTIQTLLKNPNKRVLLTNASWDLASTFLAQIKEYFLESDLRLFYGDFFRKDLSWTKSEITIAQKTDRKKRGPSIKTAGVGSSLTGSHYDLIVNDDLVEQNNSSTKEQIQKVIDFHDGCFDLMDPGAELIDIGTRWNEDDLYGDILMNRCQSVNGQVLEPGKKWRDYVTF